MVFEKNTVGRLFCLCVPLTGNVLNSSGSVIDDLVEGMFDLLEGKEQHCEFDGVETVLDENGRFCCVPVTHKVTLGEIVDLLEQFKEQPSTLMMPKMPDGSFAKKLYSLYLTYLSTDKFKYELKMNIDD